MNANENYILKLNPPKELESLLVKRINADIENKTSYAFDEVNDELTYVFGEEWRKQFKQLTNKLPVLAQGINRNTGHFMMIPGIVLSIMLAKRGYVYNNGHCMIYSSDASTEYTQ